MKSRQLYGNALLLITAFIWGCAFVAQSVGAAFVEPFTFNGVRMVIGGIVLLPFIAVSDWRKKREGTYQKMGAVEKKRLVVGGAACGVALCIGAGLQQIGIDAGTPSGKAGFITALYILLVPIAGLFFRKKVRPMIWLCVVVALAGLYLLCVTENSAFGVGDVYLLICALAFTAHILIIDHFSPRVDGVKLSCIQFFVSGLCSFVVMALFEHPSLEAIFDCWIPLLYTGALSCGVAYTLQVVGQKYTAPTVASLIMSLESVFAVLAGIVILGEIPTAREWIGCVLMFMAIIVAQIPQKKAL